MAINSQVLDSANGVISLYDLGNAHGRTTYKTLGSFTKAVKSALRGYDFKVIVAFSNEGQKKEREFLTKLGFEERVIKKNTGLTGPYLWMNFITKENWEKDQPEEDVFDRAFAKYEVVKAEWLKSKEATSEIKKGDYFNLGTETIFLLHEDGFFKDADLDTNRPSTTWPFTGVYKSQAKKCFKPFIEEEWMK